jgi:2,7-dihydroxy-5-methyl-1-naphthoate 7-O-methyltransferase
VVLLGGRQRTLAELRELAGGARLVVWAAGWQPSGRFAVECRPA